MESIMEWIVEFLGLAWAKSIWGLEWVGQWSTSVRRNDSRHSRSHSAPFSSPICESLTISEYTCIPKDLSLSLSHRSLGVSENLCISRRSLGVSEKWPSFPSARVYLALSVKVGHHTCVHFSYTCMYVCTYMCCCIHHWCILCISLVRCSFNWCMNCMCSVTHPCMCSFKYLLLMYESFVLFYRFCAFYCLQVWMMGLAPLWSHLFAYTRMDGFECH